MRKVEFARLIAAGLLVSAAPYAAFAAPSSSRTQVSPGYDNRAGRTGQARQAKPAQRVQPAAVPAAPPQCETLSGDPTAPAIKQIVLSPQFANRVAPPGDLKGVQAFYAARGCSPAWLKDGQWTEAAKAVVTHIKDAAKEGLDAADYPLPELAATTEPSLAAKVEADFSATVVKFTRHLASGRIAPSRAVNEVDYGDHTPDAAEVLKTLADARDLDAAIENYNPPHPAFRALKAKLAELRAAAPEPEKKRIPVGSSIHYGMQDSRIPAIRERLNARGKANDFTYDKPLFEAVRSMQSKNGLRPNGVIDSDTIAAINGPKAANAVEAVLANMERWRWMPRELGTTYVMVNIPDYTLKVVRDDAIVWTTKIVAGKPTNQTPLLTAPMREIIINPSWYVPQSIIQNELLPAYASDPQIFQRMGLEVRRGSDGLINVVQPPGTANALGRIKFAFPNKFQVYLHDTPEKRLFNYDRRAFSHGCMRVQDPTKFGEVMLSLTMNGPTPDSRQIGAMVGSDEKTFNLAKQPIVHLTYQTAFVDESGKLKLDADVYGLDARIHQILHSDERRVADIAPPPAEQKRDIDTLRNNQQVLRQIEQGGMQNPFAFFDRLLIH
jgi:L,D-transpeptidase YcbB